MLSQILGVILVWLAAVLGKLKDLASENHVTIGTRVIRERVIGIGLIMIATAGLILQLSKSYADYRENKRLNQMLKIDNSVLFNEASGGTMIGEIAYIVDDEKPRIFKLPLKKDPAQGHDYLGGDISFKKDGKDFDKVDDLEAAASSPVETEKGSIYLITSHSDSKSGEYKEERQRLLEVSIAPGQEGNIIQSQDHLRASIAKALQLIAQEDVDEDFKQVAETLSKEEANRPDPCDEKKGEKRDAKKDKDKDKGKDKNKGLIQIEGLAIDKEGDAYLGFRAPLIERGGVKFALVLRAPLKELFANQVEFTPFYLKLSNENNSYGIASIDYDLRTNSLLLLGSDPSGKLRFKPFLWKWDFQGKEKNNPTPSIETCGSIDDRSVASATPELLLLPPSSDWFYIFLDSDGKGEGGEIPLERTKYDLHL